MITKEQALLAFCDHCDDRPLAGLVKTVVADYANEHLDKSDNEAITKDDVYIVWMCKTLQNSNALASTNLLDGMYYELTYNGDKHELYYFMKRSKERRT